MRVASLLNSGADIETKGGMVCFSPTMCQCPLCQCMIAYAVADLGGGGEGGVQGAPMYPLHI